MHYCTEISIIKTPTPTSLIKVISWVFRVYFTTHEYHNRSMKKILIFATCMVLGVNVYAQKKKKPTGKTTIDSTQLLNKTQLKAGMQEAKDMIDASLSSKDLVANQNGEKRFYDSYPIFMKAGEELFIEHSSASFRVMLGFKNPDKKIPTEFSYDSQAFTGQSYNKFHYVASTTGTYTLLATSMDAGQVGKYHIQKTIITSGAIEAKLDPQFSKQFKALVASKKNNFKDITGEKVKKDKKDKAVQQERYLTKFELVTGKPASIIVDNGGQTANFKSTIFEGESQDDAKAYFSGLVKQLQVLTRNWTEQPGSDMSYSASTDTDIIALTVTSSEDKKKKKTLWQVVFAYN
jgi:hypothetical protein